MQFDVTSFDVHDNGNSTINITFNLVDETVTDPQTGKPTVRATNASVNFNVPKSATATQAKAVIAQETTAQLQAWYDEWKKREAKLSSWLTQNEAALETYINTHIVWG